MLGVSKAAGRVRLVMAGSGFTRSSALPPAKSADSFLAMRSDGRRAAADPLLPFATSTCATAVQRLRSDVGSRRTHGLGHLAVVRVRVLG
jgi:hypothetical protein